MDSSIIKLPVDRFGVSGNTLKASTRNELIDALRFIGAVGVVFLHFDFGSRDDSHWLELPRLLCRWIVPFFFIASGYFLQQNWQKEQEKAYLKTLFNVLSITIVADLIYLPIMIIKKKISNEPFNLFYIYGGGTSEHLWFLHSLLIGILVMGLLIHKRKGQTMLLLAFPILLLVIFSDSYFSYFYANFNSGFFRHLVSISLLIFGFKIGEAKFITQWFSLKKTYLIITASIVLQILELELLKKYGLSPSYRPSYSFGIILLSFGLFFLGLKCRANINRSISSLGNNFSLPLYLYHPLINSVFFLFWNALHLGNNFIILSFKFIVVIFLDIMILVFIQKKLPGIFKRLNGK